MLGLDLVNGRVALGVSFRGNVLARAPLVRRVSWQRDAFRALDVGSLLLTGRIVIVSGTSILRKILGAVHLLGSVEVLLLAACEHVVVGVVLIVSHLIEAGGHRVRLFAELQVAAIVVE